MHARSERASAAKALIVLVVGGSEVFLSRVPTRALGPSLGFVLLLLVVLPGTICKDCVKDGYRIFKVAEEEQHKK